MKLSRKERRQVDAGLEVTALHLREIMDHPEKLDRYADGQEFFPVYLRSGDQEALLFGLASGRANGVRRRAASATHARPI